MMRSRRFPAQKAVLVSILSAAAPTIAWSEMLEGTYASPGVAIVVQFDRCEDHADLTCGTLVWGWNGEGDLAIPYGTVIAPGLRQTEAGWEGRLTDPASGQTFRGTVTKTGNGQLLLRGCAGPFCTTERWHALSVLQSVIGQLQEQSR